MAITAHEADHEAPGFRVEELSARAGVPVRTIREYQTWQILHPPTKVGRVGHYDESHVRRLDAIARLQERGYSIAAIRDVLDAWQQGAGLGDVVGLDDAIGLPADEAPIALTAARFAELLPAIARSTRLRSRAHTIGLVSKAADGYIARSPALLQLVADAIAVGFAPTVALDLAQTVVSAAEQVGEVTAAIVATGVEQGLEGVEPLVQRGRVLLARAMATHAIDQVGRRLTEQAASTPGLGELLADVRIGPVATPLRRRHA